MPHAFNATIYAAQLLRALGVAVPDSLEAPHDSCVRAWANSGLMELTGRADGAPQIGPAHLATCADGALAALASIAPAGAFSRLRGRDLLTERAAAFGHTRHGSISAGGSCRLLPCADGVVALNLARDEDWALLPAWLEAEVAADWDAVAAVVRTQPSARLIERGRELGLALADAQPAGDESPPWFQFAGATQRAPLNRAPRVVDLSTLWAGPLCGHLLHKAGAEVIKLESTQRPDGARRGPAALFDGLNAGKRSVALDFATQQGRKQLRALLAQADIVIESARPRALRQLGIDAQELLRENPGLCWVAISGYGRGEPQENWIAYGDDAGVAAGLSQWLHAAAGEWLICGDAIADPLTGLHAALAAWAHWRAGQGGLLSLSLRDVARHALLADEDARDPAQRARQWAHELQAAGIAPHAPRLRESAGCAETLGASTSSVLGQLGIA